MTNINLPKTKIFVRKDAFGESEKEFSTAWLVSVRAIKNYPLCFQVWVEDFAACYDKVPPHCLYWKKPVGESLSLGKIQMWECLSGSIEMWRKDQFSGSPAMVKIDKDTTIGGTYWFTIDFLPEERAIGTFDIGDATVLEEHKEANFIKLDNGQIAIYPNNRIKYLPPSLTTEDAKKAVPNWLVAENQTWDEWETENENFGDSKWGY
jgi:hypothetical protein